MTRSTALDAALDVALGSDTVTGLSEPIDDHSTDAILTAAWLRASRRPPGALVSRRAERGEARTEGWTFGVG